MLITLSRVMLGLSALLAFGGTLAVSFAIIAAPGPGLARWEWIEGGWWLIHPLGYAAMCAAPLSLIAGFTLWEQEQVQRRKRVRRNCCAQCGYDRTGTHAQSPCPECGESAPIAKLQPATSSKPLLFIAALFIAWRVWIILNGGFGGGGVC
jgi:hypothetical protein